MKFQWWQSLSCLVLALPIAAAQPQQDQIRPRISKDELLTIAKIIGYATEFSVSIVLGVLVLPDQLHIIANPEHPSHRYKAIFFFIPLAGAIIHGVHGMYEESKPIVQLLLDRFNKKVSGGTKTANKAQF